MPPHKELAEHVKFWFTLSDKIVDAVILQEPHIVKGGHDGINFTEGEEREVLSELSKYCEVDRTTMEYYHPEDASMLQEQANQLILWTQSTRKELVEIRKKTMDLYKEQKQHEDNARAMSIILDTVEKMKEQREMEILSFEHHVRAMLSLVSGLHQQMAAAGSQETEVPVVEKSVPHIIISEQPQSTYHLANTAELEPSSAQIESHIARISNGLTGLASARHSYEIQLGLLQKEIENEDSLSPPMIIRPIGIMPEDIRNATRSIVTEYNSQSITRDLVNNLFKGIERGHEELELKVHNGFEIPLRTIGLQIKRYKINPAAIHRES